MDSNRARRRKNEPPLNRILQREEKVDVQLSCLILCQPMAWVPRAIKLLHYTYITLYAGYLTLLHSTDSNQHAKRARSGCCAEYWLYQKCFWKYAMVATEFLTVSYPSSFSRLAIRPLSRRNIFIMSYWVYNVERRLGGVWWELSRTYDNFILLNILWIYLRNHQRKDTCDFDFSSCRYMLIPHYRLRTYMQSAMIRNVDSQISNNYIYYMSAWRCSVDIRIHDMFGMVLFYVEFLT